MNLLEPLIGSALKIVPMAVVILIGGVGLWLLNRRMAAAGERTGRRRHLSAAVGAVDPRDWSSWWR